MPAENTVRKQRGRPFPKGMSGNPNGRPGALNKTTRACEVLLDREAEALTRKAVELAKEGNMQALRLCLDRLLPSRKDRPVNFVLPEIGAAREVPLAIGLVVRAVADGQLTPSEGQAITSMLETQKRAIETAELEQRVVAVETALKARKT